MPDPGKSSVRKAYEAVTNRILELRRRTSFSGSNRGVAGHYGFTAEELDFILNYDIKYRLGRDDGEEEVE
jgi:hypothetical protein